MSAYPPSPSCPLLGLSSELLFKTLSYLDPVDLAAVSASCKALRSLVEPFEDNYLLWKLCYARLWDASRTDDTINHADKVKSRTRATKIIASSHKDVKERERLFVLTTMLDILKSATSSSTSDGNNQAWLLNHINTHPAPEYPLDGFQMNEEAKVPNPLQCSEIASQLRVAYSHEVACSLRYSEGTPYREALYRVGNFTEMNGYGPFHRRSSTTQNLHIDWQMVENIAIVTGIRSKSLTIHGIDPSSPLRLEGSTGEENDFGIVRSIPWTPAPTPDVRDWANVEGEYAYTYVFIDFSDFFQYNLKLEIFGDLSRAQFAASASPTRYSARLSSRASPPSLDGVVEAMGWRLVRLELEEPTETEIKAYAGIPYPPLRFRGDAQADGMDVAIRGTVRMMKNGHRHWSIVSRYDGMDRWRHECVEVGQRGMYGAWTDVNQAQNDGLSPCGPVWWMKRR